MTSDNENIINAVTIFNKKRNQHSLDKLKIHVRNINIAHGNLNKILVYLKEIQITLIEQQTSLDKIRKENNYILSLIERIEKGDTTAIEEAKYFTKSKIKN